MIHMCKLNHNTYDVFLGTGWDNWARVTLGRYGYYPIAGNIKLTFSNLKKINRQLADQ